MSSILFEPLILQRQPKMADDLPILVLLAGEPASQRRFGATRLPLRDNVWRCGRQAGMVVRATGNAARPPVRGPKAVSVGRVWI